MASIRMGWHRKTLYIGLERIVRFSQETTHRHPTGCMIHVFQFGAQMTQTAANPFVLAHGITACLSFYQRCSTRSLSPGLLFNQRATPPPSNRTRSVGRPCTEASNSPRPRRMVSKCMPLIWDKSRSPPWPIFSDSKATYHRHTIGVAAHRGD